MNKIRFGYRRDKPDARDYDVGQLFTARKAGLLTLPRVFMVDKDPYVYNQNSMTTGTSLMDYGFIKNVKRLTVIRGKKGLSHELPSR
jgi:hypothetical protein